MTTATFEGIVYAAITVPSSPAVTLSATNNAGGPTTVTMTAGTYVTSSSFITQLATDLQAQLPVSGGSWQGGFEVAADDCFATIQTSNASSFSITWIDTNLRDALGFAGNISSVTAATGTLNVRGAWRPDCPIYIEGGRHRAAPRVTDLRQTRSPTGYTIGHAGNVFYQHRGVTWSHVPNHKVWIVDEGTTHESLERFMIDTQWGLGHTWFSVSSKTRITAHDGNSVGGSTATNWWWQNCRSMESIVRRIDQWDGLFSVRLDSIVSDGS